MFEWIRHYWKSVVYCGEGEKFLFAPPGSFGWPDVDILTRANQIYSPTYGNLTYVRVRDPQLRKRFRDRKGIEVYKTS